MVGGVTFNPPLYGSGCCLVLADKWEGGDSMLGNDLSLVSNTISYQAATEEQFGPSTEEGIFGKADNKRISCT